MRSNSIVFFEPLLCDAADFAQVIEHIGIQDIFAISPIEPFNERILSWLSRLYVSEDDLTFCCPLFQPGGDQFGPVICADLTGAASPGDQHLQHPDDSFSRQGSVHFDPQAFPVEVIQDVQGSEGTTRDQAIAHEIQ